MDCRLCVFVFFIKRNKMPSITHLKGAGSSPLCLKTWKQLPFANVRLKTLIAPLACGFLCHKKNRPQLYYNAHAPHHNSIYFTYIKDKLQNYKYHDLILHKIKKRFLKVNLKLPQRCVVFVWRSHRKFLDNHQTIRP